MSLSYSLRHKAELLRQNTFIKDLEIVYMSRDFNNALNKKMPRNSQNFWRTLFGTTNKNYSRLSLSTWRYQL
jgi:hypothetical protein